MVSRPQGLQTIKPYMIYSKHRLWFDLFKKHLRMMLLWFIIPYSVTTHFDKSSHEWMINIFPDIVTGKNLAFYLTGYFWFTISQNYVKNIKHELFHFRYTKTLPLRWILITLSATALTWTPISRVGCFYTYISISKKGFGAQFLTLHFHHYTNRYNPNWPLIK